ncbi:uncharacterized protein C2845_PM16G14150 [Panicum miliaceum]|uniref:Uncharacterized protein n=1 Tax=Panicum miliaceum TaxID=4540 RepID=A0A3L6PX77_PANMI|nr:uncharacterized protein C2845_PM16G14150 [Panicum miliaceum]
MHLWPSLRIRDSFKHGYLQKLELNLGHMKRAQRQGEGQPVGGQEGQASDGKAPLLEDRSTSGSVLAGAVELAWDAVLLFTCCCCCFCCGGTNPPRRGRWSVETRQKNRISVDDVVSRPSSRKLVVTTPPGGSRRSRSWRGPNRTQEVVPDWQTGAAALRRATACSGGGVAGSRPRPGVEGGKVRTSRDSVVVLGHLAGAGAGWCHTGRPNGAAAVLRLDGKCPPIDKDLDGGAAAVLGLELLV